MGTTMLEMINWRRSHPMLFKWTARGRKKQYIATKDPRADEGKTSNEMAVMDRIQREDIAGKTYEELRNI